MGRGRPASHIGGGEDMREERARRGGVCCREGERDPGASGSPASTKDNKRQNAAVTVALLPSKDNRHYH